MNRRRRLLAAVAAVVVAAALGVVWAPAAAALDVDVCDSRTAPEPRSPRQGARGLVAQRPAEVFTGDPWDADADPADLYRKHGTAGLWWPVYDSGCSPASQVTRSAENGIANVAGELSNVLIETTAAVRSWSWRSSWLEPVDDTVEVFATNLGGSTSALLGIGLIAAGGWIAVRARRADFSETRRLAGWAVAMMVLGVAAVSAPTFLAGLADRYGAGVALLVEDIIAGNDVAEPDGEATADEEGDDVRATDSLVGLTVSEVAYRNWLLGMFGEAETRVAEEYGPRFHEAMSLSWTDLELPDDELEAVKERKKQAFLDAAEDLRDEDPQAFATMQGADAIQSRLLPSLIGLVLTFSMVLFGLAAGLVLLVSRLVARFGIMALPIVIPFGLVFPYRSPVSAVAKPVLNAIVTGIMFTIAGALMARLTGALLASPMPLPLVALVVLAATVVLLVKLRLGSLAVKAVKLKIATNLATGDDGDDEPVEAPARSPQRSEDRPAPAPPSVWAPGGPPAGAARAVRPEALPVGALAPPLLDVDPAERGAGDGSPDDPARPAGPPVRAMAARSDGPGADDDAGAGAAPVSGEASAAGSAGSEGGASWAGARPLVDDDGPLRPATWVAPITRRAGDDDLYTPPVGRAGAPGAGERAEGGGPLAPRPVGRIDDDDEVVFYVPDADRARSRPGAPAGVPEPASIPSTSGRPEERS